MSARGGGARWWQRDIGGMPIWGLALSAVAVGGMLYGGASLRPTAAAVEPLEPVVVMLGDSYTAGTGASDRAHSWASLVAGAEGWRVRNLARGGTGYVTAITGDGAPNACGRDVCPDFGQMAAEGASLLPDIVVVSGGRNDLGDGTSDLDDGVTAFFDELAADYPEAHIYVTNVLWHQAAPEPVDALSAMLKQQTERIGATWLDIGQPLSVGPGLVASDGVHPDDAGHAAIADAVIAALP